MDGPVLLISAPGRTEIGGNHTDHNRGKVLAAAVNLDTLAAVSRRADRTVHIHSEGYEPMTLSLQDMAATLVEIKSRALLPRPPKPDEEDPEQTLIDRLTAYKQFKESAGAMAEFEKSAMPFLTEEVYQHLPDAQGMLILAKWPKVNEGYQFEAEERRMEGLMEIIRAIRNLRAEMKVAPGRRTHITLLPESGWEDTVAVAEPYLMRLAGASAVNVGRKGEADTQKTVSAVCAAAEIRIPLGDLVDFEKEIARLAKEHGRGIRSFYRVEVRRPVGLVPVVIRSSSAGAGLRENTQSPVPRNTRAV